MARHCDEEPTASMLSSLAAEVPGVRRGAATVPASGVRRWQRGTERYREYSIPNKPCGHVGLRRRLFEQSVSFDALKPESAPGLTETCSSGFYETEAIVARKGDGSLGIEKVAVEV